MMQKRKQPPFFLKPNADKIVESILFVVIEAARRSKDLTQYDIAKALFLADKSHLNVYGRPITFDNYVAMLHGPVPSLAYRLLREERPALKSYGKPLPWSRRSAPPTAKAYIYERPARNVDPDLLSESDMDHLRDALSVVSSLGFKRIRRVTHDDPGYVDAWEENGSAKAYPMNLALMFESPDPEKAEELAFLSQHL